jgi:uncharacterized membrane-anchored protein
MTTLRARAQAVRGSRYVATKVPQITLLFWLAKLLTTGGGETAWDWMSSSLGQYLAFGLSGAALVTALVAQFALRRYNPWVYWIAVAMVSVFGTGVADIMHNDFGVPYTVSTSVLLGAVVAMFGLWYSVERTLSFHSVLTPRREGFYWAAVLLTFALGTAAGDWSATSLGLGYLPSGILFGVLFLLPGLAWWKFGVNAVPAFWISYVLTRPLGASFADFLAGPGQRGGLELGMPPITIGIAAVTVAVVWWFARTRVDQLPTAERAR